MPEIMSTVQSVPVKHTKNRIRCYLMLNNNLIFLKQYIKLSVNKKILFLSKSKNWGWKWKIHGMAAKIKMLRIYCKLCQDYVLYLGFYSISFLLSKQEVEWTNKVNTPALSEVAIWWCGGELSTLGVSLFVFLISGLPCLSWAGFCIVQYWMFPLCPGDFLGVLWIPITFQKLASRWTGNAKIWR